MTSTERKYVLPEKLAGHWGTFEGQKFALEMADVDRSQLSYGQMSDFALANAMFMADRNDPELIVWQKAAQDRIRWLSTQLAIARSALSAAEGK